MSEVLLSEVPAGCPLGGPQTHELAFESSATDGDIAGLRMRDQNLASLCHFYRRIGLCGVPEHTTQVIGDVVIGEGNLAGKGVYAGRNFEPEETVIQYTLVPLTQEQFDALPESEKMFTHVQNGQIHLYSEPERYVNHSDNPNTYQDHNGQRDVALRRIVMGEAITTDATKDDI